MNGNIFPLPFNTHLIFCIISVAFFLFQYFRSGYKYQILMAFAVPATLLIYVSNNKIFFYAIGLFELIMLILVAISIANEKKRMKKKLATANAVIIEDTSEIITEEVNDSDDATNDNE